MPTTYTYAFILAHLNDLEATIQGNDDLAALLTFLAEHINQVRLTDEQEQALEVAIIAMMRYVGTHPESAETYRQHRAFDLAMAIMTKRLIQLGDA